MFLSPIAFSNRIFAGRLQQGFWVTSADGSIPIRIGPGHGLVITHQQSFFKAFPGMTARQFGIDTLIGERYPRGNFQFGDSNPKGGN
jgi:hypothetical protein